MAWAISSYARMHPFSFPQHFDPVHVPLQSSLKLHLAMNSLPRLSLKLHLKLSFLPSACITLHTSLLPALPCLLDWLWRRLVALGSDILFRRAPLRILDCIVPPGTYQTASRAHTVLISFCNLNCPSANNLASRAIYHLNNPFLLCNQGVVEQLLLGMYMNRTKRIKYPAFTLRSVIFIGSH